MGCLATHTVLSRSGFSGGVGEINQILKRICDATENYECTQGQRQVSESPLQLSYLPDPDSEAQREQGISLGSTWGRVGSRSWVSGSARGVALEHEASSTWLPGPTAVRTKCCPWEAQRPHVGQLGRACIQQVILLRAKGRS